MMRAEDNQCYTCMYLDKNFINQKGPRFLAILSPFLPEMTIL